MTDFHPKKFGYSIRLLTAFFFFIEFASAQSVYPSCSTSGTCVINSDQSSTVATSTDDQTFNINSGVNVSTNSNNPAFNLVNNSSSIVNNGTISTTGSGSSGSYAAIYSPGLSFTTLGSITNNGVIRNDRTGGSSAPSINLLGTTGASAGSGILDSLLNNSSGLIYTSSGNSVLLQANSTITTLTNFGSIATGGVASTYFGIKSLGSIGTLNNAQGLGNTYGALTYSGALPTNYNVIISSPGQFGRLSASSPTSSTNFGIHPGSILTRNTYTQVLSGLTTSNVGATRTGTYDGFNWTLQLESGSDTIWDLVVSGTSLSGTQQSLANTASALQGVYTLQNSVLANSFYYDCNVFGANNVCISAGGRNTAVSAANGLNNTSALLIAGYRLSPNHRIGAFADQNLSVNNAGQGVVLGNNTPLIGIFGAWNERIDDLGTEVKVSAAYGQKDTTITRQIVGTSEAGSGGSQLISQGAQVVAKYGFAVLTDVVVSPYAGVRYTQNNMGGYTEATTSAVTTPLTYSALNTNATTALAGAEARYRGIPKSTLFASAGVETDTNTNNSSYSATGVSGLTPVNFNPNPVKTRPTATVGGYYDILKNQRIGVTGIYRQEAYQAVSTTTVLATYTIGL